VSFTLHPDAVINTRAKVEVESHMLQVLLASAAGFTVLFFWLAYQHIPQVHALLDQLPALWQKRQISFVV